jgi:hypothetical protein
MISMHKAMVVTSILGMAQLSLYPCQKQLMNSNLHICFINLSAMENNYMWLQTTIFKGWYTCVTLLKHQKYMSLQFMLITKFKTSNIPKPIKMHVAK